MTHEEFLILIEQPQSVQVSQITDLKEIVDFFPYFVQPRMLLTRALQLSKSVHAEKYMNSASIYCNNRRWLYYYLFPENKLTELPMNFERTPKYSGNYFDLLDNTEKSGDRDQNKSLKNLAERLKAAREMVSALPPKENTATIQNSNSKVNAEIVSKSKNQPEINPQTTEKLVSDAIEIQAYGNESLYATSQLNTDAPIPAYFAVESTNTREEIVVSESTVKDLIKERKYEEAIAVLNKLYLINPKKSIYFADQIRFLEKVIKYTKK